MSASPKHTDVIKHAPLESELPYIVGFNVERMRTAKNINKIRFSQMIGIGRPMLDRIEDGEGNPRLSLLVKIADALEVSVNDLLEPPRGSIDPRKVLVKRKQERREKNTAKSPANRKKKNPSKQ